MLSHQGGWDEILTVILPLALIMTVLWLVARRAAGPDRGPDPRDPTPEADTEAE